MGNVEALAAAPPKTLGSSLTPTSRSLHGIRTLLLHSSSWPLVKFLSAKASLLVLLLAWAYFSRLAFMVHQTKVSRVNERAQVEKRMERTQDQKESIEFDKIRGVATYSNSSEPCKTPAPEALALQKEIKETKDRIESLNAQSRKVEESISGSNAEQAKINEAIEALKIKMHDYVSANIQLKKRLKIHINDTINE